MPGRNPYLVAVLAGGQIVDFGDQVLVTAGLADIGRVLAVDHDHGHALDLVALGNHLRPLQVGVHGEGVIRLAKRLGINAIVDLAVLIEQIVIAPQAQQWFVDLVQEVTEHYGVSVTPTYSPLNSAPNWRS